MNIVACAAQHGRRLTGLFGELSDRDLTLIKENLTDPVAVRRWAGASRTAVGGARRR
ncbi:MAG: hypothetical protein ACJ74F_14095 [Mycobacterium sp.]|uniref:hypothetical protein n=1 Tax=Mycobacterium sp. TaxID=1785 RepID=UPI00389A2E67